MAAEFGTDPCDTLPGWSDELVVERLGLDRASPAGSREVWAFVGVACNNAHVKVRRRNLEALGNLVVGNLGRDDAQNVDEVRYFPYRSSMYITEFFQELETEYQHDGSPRHRWVADV